MRIRIQFRKHFSRNSIQIHGFNFISISILYKFNKISKNLHNTNILFDNHYIIRTTKPPFIFRTLALKRFPPPNSTSILLNDHPTPHISLIHFVHPKSSNLTYRLNFDNTFNTKIIKAI